MNQAPAQQPHPAAVAQEFMKRTEMKGGEVEAYAQTFNWLAQFLSGELVIVPAEEHAAQQKELEDLRGSVAKPEEDTSNGAEMESEGGPSTELEPVE